MFHPPIMRGRGPLIVSAISAITALAACTTPGPRPPTDDAKAVQVWEYPASEFPAMCMVMKADGSLQFQGGFKFFNPGLWRVGSKPNHLIVTLGGHGPFPTQAVLAPLLSVDPKRRELAFVVDASSTKAFITVGGFYFYKVERCSIGA